LFVPFALRADLKARPVRLDELLSTSDIVTLHVPSFAGNRGMIGWAQLTKMKPSAYIINTSRGTIIDEVALIRALNEKKIAGAGLDVWNPEPPDPNNPLLQMPNVVATPHCAGSSAEHRKWSYEAIRKSFPTALEEGTLLWKPVNLEEPGNKHFVEQYSLFTKSLIITEVKGGKQIRWKNLNRVWELLGNQEKFFNYVTHEVRDYLEN